MLDAAVVPATIPGFTLSTGPATSSTGLVLDFAYTDLGTTGDDFQLTFEVVPGVSIDTLSTGTNVTVTELLCSVQTGAGGSCSPPTMLGSLGASNGGSSSSSVTLARGDFVFKDVAGGSDFTQNFDAVPEPVTFSLMGLGLVALGFAGRKRLRKD